MSPLSIATPPSLPIQWEAPFVGLPWEDGGRGPHGWDCWGLVRRVAWERFHRRFPSYGGYLTAVDRAVIGAMFAHLRTEWTGPPAGQEEPGDIVVLRRGREVCHCGIVVTRGVMLHIHRKTNSVQESYLSGKWRLRVVGFKRELALPVAVGAA